jgi:hypothetical protein
LNFFSSAIVFSLRFGRHGQAASQRSQIPGFSIRTAARASSHAMFSTFRPSKLQNRGSSRPGGFNCRCIRIARQYVFDAKSSAFVFNDTPLLTPHFDVATSAAFAADKPQRLIAETLGFEASVCSFSHPSRHLPQRLPIPKGGRSYETSRLLCQPASKSKTGSGADPNNRHRYRQAGGEGAENRQGECGKQICLRAHVV